MKKLAQLDSFILPYLFIINRFLEALSLFIRQRIVIIPILIAFVGGGAVDAEAAGRPRHPACTRQLKVVVRVHAVERGRCGKQLD